jgi:hypothetical protein
MIDPLLPHDKLPPLTNRLLRQFAGLWILFFGGFAAWQGFRHERWMLAYFFFALALSIGLTGLAVPAVMRPIFTGAMRITRPIGWVVSNVLLTVFFFVVVAPMGLLFHLIGRDHLDLRAPPNRDSFLTPKPSPGGLESYFRQS